MRRLVVLVLILSACATSHIPTANNRDEVTAYVNSAAAIVAKSGPSCATFNSAKWYEGDWYIFVLEPDGKAVCHPARPDLVGDMVNSLVDPNGMRIGEAFVTTANSPAGNGWVDYVWARPGQNTPVKKSSYVTMVTGPDGKKYIVGSGTYLP
jgi:signal transduction histidine kinase